MFELPGDGINGITEAVRQRQDRVRFIQVRHEEAKPPTEYPLSTPLVYRIDDRDREARNTQRAMTSD